MAEMKSLTLAGKKYDSFPDQTARETLKNKIPTPESGAVVGQYLRVAAVDDDGNITAVETVEAPIGPTGATPNIQIGTVETLAAGSQATASMTGTPENPLLNLGIPQGAPGSGGSGIAVTGATVGQTIRVAAVDDDGVPTAWEAVDFPSGGDEWELLTKNAETGEEEPIVMDAETLRYNFPSLAEFKKLFILIKKTYVSTSGLTGTVWFICQNGRGFTFSPSQTTISLYIDASLPGMCLTKKSESNNLETLVSIVTTLTYVTALESPYWLLPNTDWAEYYASCNTTITILGVRR